MKLYCIVRKMDDIANQDTFRLLREAVESRQMEFVPIEANNFDYAAGVQKLDTDAVVYRLSRGDRASLLEVLMVNRGIRGLYNDVNALLSRRFSWGSAIRMENASIPIIPTVYNVSKNEDGRLKEYVDHLGGFPVIVKSSGGSHGEGVMKVDSLTSLRSVIGFISEKTTATLVLRQFVSSARHLRLVVLGGEVIDTIEYNTQDDDFRTNAVEVPSVVPRNDISDDLKKIAVDSVNVLGLEFGGVDILIDNAGKPYVAEVNFPCNFARNQMNTGTDVAGKLVDYLIEKTR